jgi:hypothetical protein
MWLFAILMSMNSNKAASSKRFTCSTNRNETKMALEHMLESSASVNNWLGYGIVNAELVMNLHALEVGEMYCRKVDYDGWVVYTRVEDDTRVFAFVDADYPFTSLSDCAHNVFMVMSDFMLEHNMVMGDQSRTRHDVEYLMEQIDKLDVNFQVLICGEYRVVRIA